MWLAKGYGHMLAALRQQLCCPLSRLLFHPRLISTDFLHGAVRFDVSPVCLSYNRHGTAAQRFGGLSRLF